MSNHEKFAVHRTGANDWCVFNELDQTEVCLCLSYEHQTLTAYERAHQICFALNHALISS